jgi:hypothetical protein
LLSWPFLVATTPSQRPPQPRRPPPLRPPATRRSSVQVFSSSRKNNEPSDFHPNGSFFISVENQIMMRFFVLLLAGGLLFSALGCSGGGIDSRNKELDRPKSTDDKPVDVPKKGVQAPVKDAK